MNITDCAAIEGKKMMFYDLIAGEEGFRSKPYLCSEGYPTVGYGQRIGPKGADISLYQFEIPEPVAMEWMKFNAESIASELCKHSFYKRCNIARTAVLISMAYQMGINGLLKFRNMLLSIERENWADAAHHALDSKWAKQTPERAQRHADILRRGSF